MCTSPISAWPAASRGTGKLALLTAVLLGANGSVLPADDWPMFGRDVTRNSVSPEKNPPVFWQIEGFPTKFDEQGRAIEEAAESKNIKWIAELGHLTLGDPVVSGGLVWVGTTIAWAVRPTLSC